MNKASVVIVFVLLLLTFLLIARYGGALNPFDGCTFPEGRTNTHVECHAVDWIWNE